MKLSQVSEIVKKGVIFLGAFLFLFIIFKAFIGPAAKNVFLTIFPPKDLPNPVYGKLEPLEFTEQKTLGGRKTYELNTTTGRLPTKFPKKMPVYKYKPNPFSYNAGKQATETALFLGFEEKDLVTDLKGDVYKWRDVRTGGILEIEINTKVLTMTTSLAGKSPYYKTTGMTKDEAIAEAKNLFRSIDRFNDPLYKGGTQEVYFGDINNNRPVEAKSIAEAIFARVDFFREINKYPIVGPNRNKGMLSAVVAKSSKELLIPTLKYPNVHAYHWEINSQTNATYPIVPITSAWEAVKNGGGVISSVVPETSSPFEDYEPTRVNKILINDIYLAYFDNYTPQQYLQPIYIFEGNYTTGTGGGKIAVYFPAIAGEYIHTPETTDNGLYP